MALVQMGRAGPIKVVFRVGRNGLIIRIWYQINPYVGVGKWEIDCFSPFLSKIGLNSPSLRQNGSAHSV